MDVVLLSYLTTLLCSGNLFVSRRIHMNVSARNVIPGIIKSIKQGAVNNEIVIEVAPGVEVVSIITQSSCDRLGLKVGSKAFAMVKASSVMIATE